MLEEASGECAAEVRVAWCGRVDGFVCAMVECGTCGKVTRRQEGEHHRQRVSSEMR